MSHAVANPIEPAKSLQPAHAPAPVGKAALWTGRVISTLPALVLLLDAAMKLVKPGFVVEATGDLGFPESVIVPLGIVLAGCTILYLIPANHGAGCHPADGLSRRRDRRACTARGWLVSHRLLRRFRRPSVERAAAARRTAACGAALEPLADLGGRGTLW
jgi:DoxX-like family